MKTTALFLFVGIITLVIGGTAYADSSVTMRGVSELQHNAIRLSDVFAGVPDAIDRDIVIAPLPGKSVTYDVRVLVKLAQQYRLDWQPQSLADHVILTRSATHITQDMIRTAVLAKLSDQNIKGTVNVSFDNHTLDVALPAERSPDFTLNNFSYDATNKRFRAELMAETGASPVVIPVNGRIEVKREVPVLSHRMESGAIIGKNDIGWLSISEDHITADVITDPSQMIGSEVRHDVAENDIVRSRDIASPRLVIRGSLVTMKVETPFMLVTTQGRALQDGALGDVVRVTNTQSNRTVEGVVESSGTVSVRTTVKYAAAD